MKIIACADDKWGIGFEGGTIFKNSGDLNYFKDITLNGVVVMGRKTYESIGAPLPHRLNIIISKSYSGNTEGVLVMHSVGETLRYISEKKLSDVTYIIGGGSIYDAFSPYCDMAIINKVYGNGVKADVYMKPLKKEDGWSVCAAQERDEWTKLNDPRVVFTNIYLNKNVRKYDGCNNDFYRVKVSYKNTNHNELDSKWADISVHTSNANVYAKCTILIMNHFVGNCTYAIIHEECNEIGEDVIEEVYKCVCNKSIAPISELELKVTEKQSTKSSIDIDVIMEK